MKRSFKCYPCYPSCWYFEGNSHSMCLCRVYLMPQRMSNSVQMYHIFYLTSLPHALFAHALAHVICACVAFACKTLAHALGNAFACKTQLYFQLFVHKPLLRSQTGSLPKIVSVDGGRWGGRIGGMKKNRPTWTPWFLIFKNIEVRIACFNTYFVCGTAMGCCVTCKGYPNTKNEYNVFYHTLDAEYFFIKFFSKKAVLIFRENREKCSGGTFDHFLGKEGVKPQKLT